MGKKKKPSRKRVTVKLLKSQHAGKMTQPYKIMEALIREHHHHLENVNIAIAWRFGWRANSDGQMIMGRAKKCTDLDRELADYDFVILLNHEVWSKGGLDEKQRRALIDHELCHCEVTLDSNGELKHDEEGRLVCRIRRHDIEEFQDVVARHGSYTKDLAEFARKSINDAGRPLLGDGDAAGDNGQAADDGEADEIEEGELLPIHLPSEKKKTTRRRKAAAK